jgi:hypothetical protein
MRLLAFEFHFIFGCTREGKGKGSAIFPLGVKLFRGEIVLWHQNSSTLQYSLSHFCFFHCLPNWEETKWWGRGKRIPPPSFPSLFLPNRTKENSYLSSLPFPSNQTQLKKLLLALLCLHCV